MFVVVLVFVCEMNVRLLGLVSSVCPCCPVNGRVSVSIISLNNVAGLCSISVAFSTNTNCVVSRVITPGVANPCSENPNNPSVVALTGLTRVHGVNVLVSALMLSLMSTPWSEKIAMSIPPVVFVRPPRWASTNWSASSLLAVGLNPSLVMCVVSFLNASLSGEDEGMSLGEVLSIFSFTENVNSCINKTVRVRNPLV